MKKIFLAVLVVLFGQWVYSQALFPTPICYGAVPARRPVSQAQVELVATDKGLLLPRVKDTSAVTAVAKSGLMIFSTSDNQLYMYNGNRWVAGCYCNGPGAAGPVKTGGGTGTGVGIGTDNPDPRAAMDITATDRGLLLARVQDTNAIVQGGVAGLLIYSMSDNRYYIHNGTAWMQMGVCGSGVLSGLPANANAGGITGNLVDPSAMVELRSSNRGLLLPLVKDTNAIKLGGMWGLLIYSTTDNRLYLHNGRSWMQLCANIPGTPARTTGFANCPGTASGTLTQGQSASNVSIRLDYTGGNGGAYAGFSIQSTGVRGLTATLLPGTLSNGSGSLVFTISGVPLGNGTASFPVSFGGVTCIMTIKVAPIPGIITGLRCNSISNLSYGNGYYSYYGPDLAFFDLTYTASNGGFIPEDVLFVGSGLGLKVQTGVWLSPTGGTVRLQLNGLPTVSRPVLLPFTIGGQRCSLNFFNGIVY